MTIRKIIVDYIEEIKNEEIVDYSMNLFENGFLTSLDVLDLISFIEKKFNFTFSGDDIDIESFGSINAIENLIGTKCL